MIIINHIQEFGKGKMKDFEFLLRNFMNRGQVKYVISKMPVDIKKNNANLFVNCIDKEFVGCNYKMTKIHLILLYEQTELGRFNLI